MSILQIFNQHAEKEALLRVSQCSEIQRELNQVGVRFEQWAVQHELAAGANAEEVLKAYQNDIDKLISQAGYQAVDVVSLNSNHPDKAVLRQKFLSEHTHTEDEVRFFVAGEGLFTLHIKDKVYEVICEKGDLISVPANTPHWFAAGKDGAVGSDGETLVVVA